MTLPRRSVLKAGLGAGVVALARPFDRALFAQGPHTRFSVTTVQGKAMLARYAKAVGLMRDEAKYPVTDARSWKSQWYTHWIPGPQTPWSAVAAAKTKMLDTVFAGKPANDPGRLLAQAMWDDCQAHGTNPNDPSFYQEMFFCVWHRWFLYCFEEIIRGVLGDDTFTLPYWDYLAGTVQALSLPPEFLDKASPLFEKNRNAWVNAGERIDKQNPDTLNLDAFDEPAYIDSANGGIGFCPSLDQNPHGLVHSYIGTSTNMGRVPYAANDPIFWVHHCNLDRLWESWNRVQGQVNPTWPDRPFPFADAKGKGITVLPAKADRVAMLTYEYDTYYTPPSPPLPTPSPIELTAMTMRKLTLARASAPVTLGSERVRVPLGVASADPATLPVAAAGGPAGRRFYLELGGVAAAADAGATYNVYLDLAEGAGDPGAKDPHYAGTLHFFSAMGAGTHEMADHRFVLNVTKTIKALQASGKVTATPTVTLVRRGAAETAKPSVGSVLLSQV